MKVVLNAQEPMGRQLKALRIGLGIKQADIARAINVSSSNLCHFENGTGSFVNSGMVLIFKYIKALGYDEALFKI